MKPEGKGFIIPILSHMAFGSTVGVGRSGGFDDVVGGNVIFKDLKGKNFKDIIGKLTTKLKEIKTKQDPLSRAMDEFNVGLPEYGRKLSATEYRNIYYACFSDENIH